MLQLHRTPVYLSTEKRSTTMEFQKWVKMQGYSESVQSLYEEAFACYKVNACRSAFIMSFLAFQNQLKERLLHFGWVKLTKTPFERSLPLPSVASASLARLAFHRFWGHANRPTVNWGSTASDHASYRTTVKRQRMQITLKWRTLLI